MSMPSIPNIQPTINAPKDSSINLILASVGLEELSLSHILNAEAEKVQYVLGTLGTTPGAHSSIEINSSSKSSLRDTLKSQMKLGVRPDDLVELIPNLVLEEATTV